MRKLPSFVDMAMSDTDNYGSGTLISGPKPIYPYGLQLCFGSEQLERLNLEDDCEVGDMVHIFAIAKVVSVNKRDTTDGPKTSVDLQITHIATESEDAENASMDFEEDKKPMGRVKNPYK